MRRRNRNQTRTGCGASILSIITIGIIAAASGLLAIIWRAMPMISQVIYYMVAWPYLLFEHIWNIGGTWRKIAQAFLVGAAIVGLTSFIISVANAPEPSATDTPVPPPATDTPVPPPATDTPVPPPATDTPVPPPATDTPMPPPAPAPATGSTLQMPADVVPAQVSRVVDGDTVRVIVDNQELVLRLIGIDTPETVAPNRPVECYGPEASAFTKQTLTNQQVYLEYDPSQGRVDRYQRDLVYVWLNDGRNFNELLIRDGFAFEYTYDSNYKYQSAFRSAERDADQQDRGLWSPSTCNGESKPLSP